jgi:hypothetical protein
MLDHMILTVSNVERSLAFYEAALKPLNIKFFLPFKCEVTREQRGSGELVRSPNECVGDLESTEEAFCCPDFRVTTRAFASIRCLPN